MSLDIFLETDTENYQHTKLFDTRMNGSLVDVSVGLVVAKFDVLSCLSQLCWCVELVKGDEPISDVSR